MYLYKTVGVPRKGWICIGVIDLGSGNYEVCQMCGNEKVRFIHKMQHEEFKQTVSVGCVCSGHMTDDYSAARRRDADAKKIACRRSYWLKRKWLISRKGSAYVKVDGRVVGVFNNNGVWKCFVNKMILQPVFKTSEEAKMHLFNYINDKFTRISTREQPR